MSEMGEESYPLYKVVMLGNLGVGKSTFFIKFRDGVFREDIDDCGLDKSTKLYSRQNGTVALQLWDTAGMERTGSLTDGYFRNSHAVLLMYDTTERSTFHDIAGRWRDNARRYSEENTMYFVVGTKIDDKRNENITRQVTKSLSSELFPDIPENHFFRISVKEDIRIESCLNEIVDALIKASNPTRRRNKFVSLTEPNEPLGRSKWKSCC